MRHLKLVSGGQVNRNDVVNVSGRFATITTWYPPMAHFFSGMEKLGWTLYAQPCRGIDGHGKEKYFMTFCHAVGSVEMNSEKDHGTEQI